MFLLDNYIKKIILHDVIYYNKNMSINSISITAVKYFNKQPYYIIFGINLTLLLSKIFNKYDIILLKNFINLINNIIILIQVEKR